VTTVAEPAATPPPGLRSRWQVLERLLRPTLAVACLAMVLSVLAVGERESSLADLEQAVSSGDVDVVQVSDGRAGDAEVMVSWRDGLVRHITWVMEAPRHDDDPFDPDGFGDFQIHEGYGDSVIEGDVRSHLTMLDPDVRFESVSWRGHESTIMEWGVPYPLWVAVTVMFLLTLLAIPLSPRPPWRATRWAWFWLVLGAAPVAVPAYLLLAGPAAGVPHPRPGASRLTGGWAFLLSVVAGTLVGAL
jgi:hypothetical protein